MAPFSHDDSEEEYESSEASSGGSQLSEKSSSGSSLESSSEGYDQDNSSSSQITQRRMSARERKIRSRKIAAKSSFKCKHNPFTHFPKDPECSVCQQSKMMKPEHLIMPSQRASP